MRVSSPAIEIKDIWDALTAAYGAAGTYGLLIETNLDGKVSDTKAVVDANKVLIDLNLDSKVSLAKADLTTLETRLSAIRAGYLDELAAANLPTDIIAIINALAAIPTVMVGTNGAALASAWTAGLATILGNFTSTIIGYLNNVNLGTIPNISTLSPARIGYLDNIDMSLKELFYEHFASTVDDVSGAEASGTAVEPFEAIDNNLVTKILFDVNQYVDINIGRVAYCKRARFYWDDAGSVANRYSLQAYVNGSWVTALTAIEDLGVTGWGEWLTFPIARTAFLWRFKCTVDDTNARIGELELEGVTVG